MAGVVSPREDGAARIEVLPGAQHLPFTVSGGRSYFIGFTDMVPDGLGQHVKGEMNGLWIPPLRLLKNIVVRRDSGELSVKSFSVLPWKRIIDFGTARLEMMIPEETVLLIRLNSKIHTVIELELKPIPVWLDSRNAQYRVTNREDGRTAVVEFPGFHRSFSISFGRGKVSIGHEKISLSSEGESFILMEEGNIPKRRWSGMHLGRLEHSAISAYSGRLSGSVLSTGDKSVESAYYWSKLVLAWLSHTQDGIGTGITAGHPEFPWYFGFDTFLTFDALLECGMFDIAAGSIEILSARAKRNNGRVPHEIITNGHVYNEGDMEESAMFATSLLRYYDWTLDREFLNRHAMIAYNALCFVLDRDMRGPGAMEDAGRGAGKDIDTMCFFSDGVASLEHIGSVLGAQGPFSGFSRLDELREAAASTRRTVENEMWIAEQNIYANRIVDGVPVFMGFWTSMMPFYSRTADESRYRKFASARTGGLQLINGRYGIAADRRGAAMPIQNGMMCIASLQYGDGKTARKYFMHNMRAYGKYSPCCIPEITNRRNGCYMQAWSSAMLIHPLVHGFIGLSVTDGAPSLKPEFIGMISRTAGLAGVHIGGRIYDFSIQTHEERDVECSTHLRN